MNINDSLGIPAFPGRRLRRRKNAKRAGRKSFRMKNIVEPRKWSEFGKDDDRKYDFDEFRKGIVNMDFEDFKGEAGKEFFLAASSLNDHYITKIIDDRTISGKSTITIKEELVAESRDWKKFVEEKYANLQIIQFGESTGMAIDNENLNFVDFTINSNSIQVRLYGDKKFVNENYDAISNTFQIAPCYVEWVYGGDGSSVNIPLLPEKLPISEMYPFLGDESIGEYYDRYIQSSASILLLIGPPGTGKTTFIRGLLHHASKNAIVTYDEKILDRDYVFARFIEDDVGVMVVEDADNFLKSRADGNTMMHRFLNVGDGLISMRGKKLIFSTNLPSIHDVDSALIRPGRCFDVVSFDNYTLEQAQKLANKLGVSFEEKPNKSDTYSLAEVFFKQRNSNPKQTKKMGFI
jgi:energy-coupling factor transporter ATP-binding protein EcfA2